MQYQCTLCGQFHEDWPAIGFSSPTYYNDLTSTEKQELSELSSDICIIRDKDQTDYFIRAVLYQKVDGQVETLHYGVWVSLSQTSFEDYIEHFNDDSYEATYFGFLSNNIPSYDSTLGVKTDVVYNGGGSRPEVIPHESQTDFDFVDDYWDGISFDEAMKRIHAALGDGHGG